MLKKWIRILWRLQPQWMRQLELNALAAFATRPVDPKRLMPPGNVVVAGFLGTGSGMGEAARQMLREFQAGGIHALGANVSRFAVLEDFEAGPLWPENAGSDGLLVFHVNPSLLNLALFAIGRKNIGRRKIAGCWAWELDVVPKEWVRAVRYVDEVWAPSHFIANALRKVVRDKPIYILPYPMDIASVPTVSAIDPLPEFKGKVIVFFTYDVRSVHARKNPEAVIAAFNKAAQDRSDTVLIIKVHGEKSWPEAIDRLNPAAARNPNIHILRKTFPANGMRDLMARVDIVISLHRSEGFGFLMAEAMAAAKPVIATGWSANLDFMTEDSGILINYKLVPVVDPQHVYDKYGAMWADPDVDQAAKALRNLLENPAERQRLGQAARAQMMAYSSKENWFKSLPPTFWESLTEDAKGKTYK